MRKFLIVLINIVALSMPACRKEEVPTGDLFPVWLPGDIKNGQITAIKSQTEWEASAYGNFHTNRDFLYLTATTYSAEGYEREGLTFSFLPLSTGRFPVDRLHSFQMNSDKHVHAAYYTIGADGDVLEDFFYLDTLATDNYVRLIRVDTVNRVMEGFFTVSFVRDTLGGRLNPFYPDDRIKFSNGYFRVKISN